MATFHSYVTTDHLGQQIVRVVAHMTTLPLNMPRVRDLFSLAGRKADKA
jgi:hypothetical protein